MRGGDVAFNPCTGEFRIVVSYDKSRNEVTFVRDSKWYSAKDWVTSLGLHPKPNGG